MHRPTSPIPEIGKRDQEYTVRRNVTPGIRWFEYCSPYQSLVSDFTAGKLDGIDEWFQFGRTIHLAKNVFLIRDDRSLLFDTGTFNSANMVELLEEELGGDELEYIVVSHPDADHAGNVERLLEAYPEATLVAPAQGVGHELYLLEQSVKVGDGDCFDLGSHAVEFITANAFVDAEPTIYMVEQTTQTLFTVDWFLIPHMETECGIFAAEVERGGIERRLAAMAARLYYWLPWSDITKVTAEIEYIIQRFEPRIIAPSHGFIFREGAIDQLRQFKALTEEIHEHGPAEVLGAGFSRQFH